MAICRLEIFKTRLKPEMNAKIEDIDFFLNNKDYATKTYDNSSFQYQKITLDKEIKVTASQDDFNGLSIGNYIRITQDGNKYYYFIMSNEWTSVNSCALNCSIDSINTFADKLEFSDKTNIIRQHEDRFNLVRTFTKSRAVAIVNTDVPVDEGSYHFEVPELIGAANPKISSVYVSFAGSHTNVYSVQATVDESRTEFDTVNGNADVYFYFTSTHGDSPESPIMVNTTITISYDEIRRKVNYIPEGINPQLYGKDVGTIYNKNDDENWYLIYNSTTADKAPVETLLCKDTGITTMISSGSSNSVTITPDLLDSTSYYFIDPFNGTAKEFNPYYGHWTGTYNPQYFKDQHNVTVFQTGTRKSQFADRNDTNLVCAVLQKDGNRIKLLKLEFYLITQQLDRLVTHVSEFGTYDQLTITSNSVFDIHKSGTKPENASGIDLYYTYNDAPLFVVEGTTKVPAYISDFKSLNRAAQTLIKIIKLPYCPLEYTVDNEGRYVFTYNVEIKDATTDLGGKFIKLNNNMDFGITIETNLNSPFEPIYENMLLSVNVQEPKNIKYETKLYHSEFYQPKFIYDSFGFDFDLEKQKNVIKSNKLKMNYTPSRMFNSAMMFSFPDYQTDGKDTQDFNNILIANRNNEMPIYNSEYLNYIKNGYNYDVKVKNANYNNGMLSAGLGLTASLVTAGASGGTKLVRGMLKAKELQEDLAVMSKHGQEKLARSSIASNAKQMSLTGSLVTSQAITSSFSSIGRIIGLSQQAKMDEMAIEQKKKLLADQAVSVSSCDSVDLLDKYCNNKAKLKLYTVNDATKEQLFDLFYYNGYAKSYKDIPNTSSRYWFNYIQCEPEFKGIGNITYENYIDDIKERYAAGVTVYHCHTNQTKPYDIDQEYENWETNLIN